MSTKRASWTESNLLLALNAIQAGCSQRVAAKQFKIPWRTLQNHLQFRNKKKRLGRGAVLTDQQEKGFVLVSLISVILAYP